MPFGGFALDCAIVLLFLNILEIFLRFERESSFSSSCVFSSASPVHSERSISSSCTHSHLSSVWGGEKNHSLSPVKCFFSSSMCSIHLLDNPHCRVSVRTSTGSLVSKKLAIDPSKCSQLSKLVDARSVVKSLSNSRCCELNAVGCDGNSFGNVTKSEFCTEGNATMSRSKPLGSEPSSFRRSEESPFLSGILKQPLASSFLSGISKQPSASPSSLTLV
mmetsp:Transcript_4190/g.11564  ORF Transcript_4190/g.11564 Transcript_4190/m.11564 type:complete len:219 (+) Transcript_4190:519-1175(+)